MFSGFNVGSSLEISRRAELHAALLSTGKKHARFINNSLKHAEATAIEINIKQYTHETLFNIKDNGCGFNVLEEKLGSGLTNMKMRATMIGVDFEIKSNPQKGTEVQMALQIKTDKGAYEI